MLVFQSLIGIGPIFPIVNEILLPAKTSLKERLWRDAIQGRNESGAEQPYSLCWFNLGGISLANVLV
jgi:hypothetical protein